MKKGILFSASAYVLWGFFPIYFKALYNVPAAQILAHRVVWSFLFLAAFLLARQEITALLKAISRRILLIYLTAGVLLGVNWLTYVWAVNDGRVVESSLGYFINPLVSVLLGVIFLRERLRTMQWAPVGLAAAGVAYLTIRFGQLPWVALVLAFTFGFYGLFKKIAPLGARQGLLLETALICLPMFLYLIFAEFNGSGVFLRSSSLTSLLLALSGLVTIIPLLLFAAGAQLIPLTIIGLLQYIAPTLQFLIGVLLYNEPFTLSSAIGFGFIWLALILFSLESYIHNQRSLHPHPIH
ncbi:MAG: EamA family transporter RarD [Bellilinea sp.]|jgi:chloramphenicol-sensitive protein RarD